ncbi:YceI family protein [Saccharopolyspora flava]|uniref:Polyisoprenoid-binding protein YceI n=1 Tax=Saccharopolyspora flava TaxID=95161 RepID=A0A1I6SSA4_9PSEU|nr:YceI family protein [Saccharopolyspora flava]SFS79834.1 Polyisoprenoid-binding protein YceI [Saccharopolyspora flava]
MTEATDPGQLTGDYTIDPAHSRLGFVARHAMVTKVRGQFLDVEGQIHVDAENPANSSGTARMKTSSIDTGQQQRDEHLRTADFFDIDNHPEIVFTSTSVRPKDESTFTVTGDLDIKGNSKPVEFDLEYTGQAKDPFGDVRVGFEGSLQVNRKDWGLTWNAALETGGWLVSEKITIELDISAVKKS